METCPNCGRPVCVTRLTNDAGMTYRVLFIDPLTGGTHLCPGAEYEE